VADKPTIGVDAGQPKVPFLLRRAGETRVLQSPLAVESAEERFALYLGKGKRRQDLARVQGRTVVSKRVGANYQISSYRRYLRGVSATALCVLDATSGGTRALVSLTATRYRRNYTVGLLLAGIVAILIFAPATSLWMRTLLAFGILLVVSNWRLSRPTRETVEEKRFLAEFVRNLLEAEEIGGSKRSTPAIETTMAKGRSG
jgi:hypothetical protein